MKKSALPLGCENRGENVADDKVTKVSRDFDKEVTATVGGADGGCTGKVRSDDPDPSLSKSLNSASFKSWKADLGTLGISSRNVLTSAKSKPNTSANLKKIQQCSELDHIADVYSIQKPLNYFSSTKIKFPGIKRSILVCQVEP